MTKFTLHLTFLIKIHICAFAALNFSKISRISQKFVLRIPLKPFRSGFCALPYAQKQDRRNAQKQDHRNAQKTGSFWKKSNRDVLGGNYGSKSVGLKNWPVDHGLGSREQNAGIRELQTGLKYSKSYCEAFKALISLLAW